MGNEFLEGAVWGGVANVVSGIVLGVILLGIGGALLASSPSAKQARYYKG